VPTPDVRLQQLTAENQELKTRNEKLTASVELLGKEIQELRTRIDQALARDLQQSPATQVIEVSPDGTTKNVVRITVEVALAQKK
jgi:phage shock protein A